MSDEELEQRIYSEIPVMLAGKGLSDEQHEAIMDDRKESVELIMRLLKSRDQQIALAAQENAVAWVIMVIDEFHSMPHEYSNQRDKFYKGVKNGLRDRYRSETGIDPAPSYPIKATLKSQEVSK